MLAPPRTVVRREAGLYALERALQRRGFSNVAGADEAGRGACAGPLVAAAAMLPEGRRGEIEGLADSKLLTPAARERVYERVVRRALAYTIVVVPPAEVDARGLHVCNLAAMRRALASLDSRPDYVLTDGFSVDGLGVPGLAVWKGDRVAACVAAASVLAKVTRDRMMVELDGAYPEYGFAEHKGYVTPEHSAALRRHGPCSQHRFSYVNVAAVSALGFTGFAQVFAEAPVEVPVEASAAGLGGGSGPSATRGQDPPAEGTVGVACGARLRRLSPVGEDVPMEGGGR
jgi:ribonuclease HII